MNDLNLVAIGAKLGMIFVPFLFALCFHEFSHALVAKWRGDNTGERMGRLSLNPFAHSDPIGTWVLPIAAIVFNSGMMFGWAKPVPVDSRNLKRPLHDMFWIALAGPASNVLLALLSTVGLAFVLAHGTQEALTVLLQQFIFVNLALAIFNLIPINPLDGGKVIAPFLPIRWNMWLEQNQGMLSMMLLVFLLMAGGILSIPITWAGRHLLAIAQALAVQLA